MNDFMTYDFQIEKIVLACFVAAGTGGAVHKNRPSHGLALNLGGLKAYTFSDGNKLTVKKHDIIYLPKFSNYTVTTEEPGDCYAINFDVSENINFPPFVLSIKNHNDVLSRFKTATKIWGLKKNSYILKCKAELYNIIYNMHQEYFAEYFPKNRFDSIKPAVDYIHENYASENISIDVLSKMCNITPEYFRKIFKSFYGVSPISYINNLKITRAKELLNSQMYSVKDTSLLSGFNDISYFSREFKKMTGLSPLSYRKRT